MDDLLPCPFCGSDDIDIQRHSTPRQSAIVSCCDCGCVVEGPTWEIWNRRSAIAMLAAETPQPEEGTIKGVKSCPTKAPASILNSKDRNLYVLHNGLYYVFEVERPTPQNDSSK